MGLRGPFRKNTKDDPLGLGLHVKGEPKLPLFATWKDIGLVEVHYSEHPFTDEKHPDTPWHLGTNNRRFSSRPTEMYEWRNGQWGQKVEWREGWHGAEFDDATEAEDATWAAYRADHEWHSRVDDAGTQGWVPDDPRYEDRSDSDIDVDEEN